MKTTSTIILCGCALLATAPLSAAAEPEVGQAPAPPAAAIEKQDFEGKTITGLEIRREITLKPGDWFNPVELEAAKARLTSLRRFSEVNVSGSPGAPGFRDVDVLVQEHTPEN